MAKIIVHYLNGQNKEFYNAGTSVFKGFLYIWRQGVKRKGSKPIAKISLSELHSKKKTGVKMCDISKF